MEEPQRGAYYCTRVRLSRSLALVKFDGMSGQFGKGLSRFEQISENLFPYCSPFVIWIHLRCRGLADGLLGPSVGAAS